jgi:adenosine deaminase
VTLPKIELHVHLKGTVRAATAQIAADHQWADLAGERP